MNSKLIMRVSYKSKYHEIGCSLLIIVLILMTRLGADSAACYRLEMKVTERSLTYVIGNSNGRI